MLKKQPKKKAALVAQKAKIEDKRKKSAEAQLKMAGNK